MNAYDVIQAAVNSVSNFCVTRCHAIFHCVCYYGKDPGAYEHGPQGYNLQRNCDISKKASFEREAEPKYVCQKAQAKCYKDGTI